MSSQSERLSLSMIGKEMRRLKENGLRSKEDLRMHMRKKMWLITRSLIQLRKDMGCNMESIRIKEIVGIH